MMLMKDHQTQKKSLTVTCLVLTFLLACGTLGCNLYVLVQGKETNSSLVWAAIGLLSPFVGLYWQKRFKATATGIEFTENDDDGILPTNPE